MADTIETKPETTNKLKMTDSKNTVVDLPQADVILVSDEFQKKIVDEFRKLSNTEKALIQHWLEMLSETRPPKAEKELASGANSPQLKPRLEHTTRQWPA